jgi:hypothetical protein
MGEETTLRPMGEQGLLLRQFVFTNRQVLARSNADGLHSAWLLPRKWTDDEIAEHVLVPIKPILDIDRQDVWTGRVRRVSWIDYAEQTLCPNRPQPNARRTVVDRQTSVDVKAFSDDVGSKLARVCQGNRPRPSPAARNQNQRQQSKKRDVYRPSHQCLGAALCRDAARLIFRNLETRSLLCASVEFSITA